MGVRLTGLLDAKTALTAANTFVAQHEKKIMGAELERAKSQKTPRL
jgi:hypothetical protein